MILCRAFRLMLCCAALAGARAEPSAPAYALCGRTLSETQLRAAYAQVWRHYVVDQDSRQVHRAETRGGFVVKGAIRDGASLRRLIVQQDHELVVVQCQEPLLWKPGDTLERVVVPCGAPRFSYVAAGARPRSLRQFADATLTFDAFVRSLRAGQHYPEIPELGTKPDRNGQLRTDHIHMNSLVDP